MPALDVTAEQERFEGWLFHIDDYLEAFLGSLPDDLAAQLDFGADSLEPFEDWLLRSFAGPDELASESASALRNNALVYLGETFRRQAGGTWSIALSNEKDLYYGHEIVSGVGTPPTRICPGFLLNKAVDRRTNTVLQDVLKLNLPA